MHGKYNCAQGKITNKARLQHPQTAGEKIKKHSDAPRRVLAVWGSF